MSKHRRSKNSRKRYIAKRRCWRFTNYEKNKGYRVVIKLELKGVVDGIDGNDFLGFS